MTAERRSLFPSERALYSKGILSPTQVLSLFFFRLNFDTDELLNLKKSIPTQMVLAKDGSAEIRLQKQGQSMTGLFQTQMTLQNDRHHSNLPLYQ